MSPLTATLIISAFILLDLTIVTAVLNFAAGELRTLAKTFPPIPPQIHAERRNFQSFRLGLMNFGWSFHVVADAGYVHMHPAWLFRKLGATDFSIPRTELKNPQKSFSAVRVTLAGNDLRGPRWCLAPHIR